MRIVAASMCDADCVTCVINCSRCRSIGQSSVLPHGKCVHVSSREYGLACTIAQDANDAGTAHAVADFVAEVLEFRRHKGGGFGFLKAQLWMRMQILVNTFLPNGSFLQAGENVRNGRRRWLVAQFVCHEFFSSDLY